MVKSYKDLDVWKKSIELVKDIYKLVKLLPKEEMGSLCELETQVIITKEIGYINNIDKIEDDMIVIKKMINSMINSLKAKI